MHVQVKMITGVWANTDTRSPLQFQFVADPTKSWKDIVFSELCAAIRSLQPTKVSIDGYYANPQDILVCDTWEKVADLFNSIPRMLLRDEDKEFVLPFDGKDKEFVLTFEGKDEKFHLYFRNF